MESITLTVTTSEGQINENNRPVRDNDVIVKGFVFNKEAVESLVVKSTNSQNDNNNIIEYLIVTNEKLKPSFESLARWKTTKGVRTKIYTINEIITKYQYSDRTLAIKKCLYDLFINNGLKYVLLGGDDTIVPVKGCYCRLQDGVVDFAIPADMYYGCFGGEFNWNLNGNGLYGEVADGIELSPNIYVTRLPVESESDVVNYTNKLLQYEKCPYYSDKILLGGANIGDVVEIISDNKLMSDAEYHANTLYQQYIQPFWNGKRYRFFDTGGDFSKDFHYGFNPANLQQQLEKGYSFVNIDTHGFQTGFHLCDKTKYSLYHAENLINRGHTILVTSACITNAFDTKDKKSDDDLDLTNRICLSEGFIRNPNSGIIGYLGSSRYGIGCANTQHIGISNEFSANFFKFLFSQDIPEKNFGRIVAAAKASLISQSLAIADYRWVNFFLNPIGDPEMPIFISTPLSFDSVRVVNMESQLIVDVGIEDCRICVMSKSDNGSSYYKVFDRVDKVSLDSIPLDCSICITKQGYRPMVLSIGYIPDHNLFYLGPTTGSNDKASIILNCRAFSINSSNVIIQGETIINGKTEFVINSQEY